MCGICWNDYEDNDQPVKLPCGHVFGEECVLAWARGTTPTGRHNGCPSCRAELLPRSLQSCISAVCYWLSDLWPILKDVFGGTLVVALWAGLVIVYHGTERFPNSQLSTRINSASMACLAIMQVAQVIFSSRGLLMLLGWRYTILVYYMVAMLVKVRYILWLIFRF